MTEPGDPRIPTRQEVISYLTVSRNWKRWGESTELGAFNLITDERVRAAVAAVKHGSRFSLAKPFPVAPAADNPRPASHLVERLSWDHETGKSGAALDYYGCAYHGLASTHLDALCHTWVLGTMWGGRDPDEVLSPKGSEWGGIDVWRRGFITRGVMFDVPEYRGVPYVAFDRPVHGWELKAIAEDRSLNLQPGDAVVVYSGRDSWDKENQIWGTGEGRAGLHASCLPFIRAVDCSLLVWDMMDLVPSGYDLPPYPVHKAITAYGIGLVDNAALAELASACREHNQYEFMLMASPLVVRGGTGSPINPIAVL